LGLFDLRKHQETSDKIEINQKMITLSRGLGRVTVIVTKSGGGVCLK